MGAFVDRSHRLFRLVIERVVGYAAAVVVLGTTLLTILEVVRRYVFGVVFHWGQDAVTYFTVGAIFLFFAVTQVRRAHLAMTALLEWLEAKGHLRMVLVVRALSSALSAAFFASFAYWGLPIAERSFQMGRMTQTMVIPLWPFQYALLAGLVLAALAALFQLYDDLRAVASYRRGQRVGASGQPAG